MTCYVVAISWPLSLILSTSLDVMQTFILWMLYPIMDALVTLLRTKTLVELKRECNVEPSSVAGISTIAFGSEIVEERQHQLKKRKTFKRCSLPTGLSIAPGRHKPGRLKHSYAVAACASIGSPVALKRAIFTAILRSIIHFPV